MGKPIPTDKMTYDDRDILTETCKGAIADMKQVPLHLRRCPPSCRLVQRGVLKLVSAGRGARR